MTTRMQVVEEARRWIGTPYHHAGRLRGIGVDCIGAIVVPAICAGVAIEDITSYGRQPNREATLEHLRARMDEIPPADARVGDVLYLWLGHPTEPHHFVLLTPRGILHVRSEVVRGRGLRSGNVCETSMPIAWANQIDSAWRFRGLED